MNRTLVLKNSSGRTILGRYELKEQVGRGGFSTVYRAYDLKMGREVAVKAVLRSEEFTARATHEAKAAAKLSHPHIVTVFELTGDEHEIYIVSELVKGRTLKSSLYAGLADRDCLIIMLQVLEALAHAHDQGVIHRDIKPENIMLAEDKGPPSAKVMDFGIAQLENTQRITRRGDVVGTISYMSPEQADGLKVEGTTDVYSAALTLYECLAGANPFRAATVAETIGRIQAGAPPLAEARPDLPRELSHLIEEAMDPDPQLRSSPRSFAARLDEIISLLPEAGQSTTVLKRAGRPRPSLAAKAWNRYDFVFHRLFNSGLAALAAYAAVYGSAFYPASWRLPLLILASLLVALVPRTGMITLALIAILPVMSFSPALGVLLSFVVALYFLAVGLMWPASALIPVLAVALGYTGLGLIYPGISGVLGGAKRGLILAGVGGCAFTFFQLFYSPTGIDYLGVMNEFGLKSALAGQSNPIAALSNLAEPFLSQPVLLMQPALWLAAAIPALFVRGRRRIIGAAALLGANLVLGAGYLSLPLVVPDFALNSGVFLKTLLVCVIIQIGFLLISPETILQSTSPRERIKET